MTGSFAFLLMGVVLGLIGGGGSILTVPILVYMFSLTPQEATGSSLFIVGTTSLVGAALAWSKKEIQLSQSLPFAIPSLLGVFLARTVLLPHTPDPVIAIQSLSLSKDTSLMILFAGLMLMASFKMIRGGSSQGQKPTATPTTTRVAVQGALVGVVTGFIGAGGGFLIIPALVFLLKMTMRSAAGTSLLIIAMNSAIGFASDLFVDPSKNWSLLFSSTGFAILGLLGGRRWAPLFSEAALKRIFGWFVLLLGTGILWQQLQ